jgi:hypothetical protein
MFDAFGWKFSLVVPPPWFKPIVPIVKRLEGEGEGSPKDNLDEK